jgi:S-disulfanyl-L-cysteine oxidoreductase SoxD
VTSDRVFSALFLTFIAAALLTGCRAKAPGPVETAVVNEAKDVTIGGEDWTNPTPDTPETVKRGAEHFRHHCQVCHGLDGQNTGVPFADHTSPRVANLASREVQDYKDGQLKWIIENGIRFSGMPSWKHALKDDEMWAIVRYLRNLPPKGSVGIPEVYKATEAGSGGHGASGGSTKGGGH